MITTKNKFGLLNSIDDQPSLIDDEGNKYWHLNGVPYRANKDLPFVEMLNGNKYYRLNDGGYIVYGPNLRKYYNCNNRLDKKDGPAYMSTYDNGDLEKVIFYNNGLHHRENGPSFFLYYQSLKIKTIVYSKNDKIHREDGPAVI